MKLVWLFILHYSLCEKNHIYFCQWTVPWTSVYIHLHVELWMYTLLWRVNFLHLCVAMTVFVSKLDVLWHIYNTLDDTIYSSPWMSYIFSMVHFLLLLVCSYGFGMVKNHLPHFPCSPTYHKNKIHKRTICISYWN